MTQTFFADGARYGQLVEPFNVDEFGELRVQYRSTCEVMGCTIVADTPEQVMGFLRRFETCTRPGN